MRNFFIIFLLFVSFLGFSQSNYFTVLDSETGEPLPYVNICFECVETGAKDFSITGTNGKVVNKAESTCIVALSFVGYKTIIDTITPNTNKIYKLEPDVFNLEQIVVTATRSGKTLKDVPVITQVISAKDIEDRGLSTVEEVLEQDIPGLDFQQVGFGTNVSMQGLEAKNILILVDGERLAGDNGNNIDYSRLNTENIEKIEIVKGASSALYGSQAMGGVINIITKNPRKKVEFSFSSKLTERNQVNYHDLEEDDRNYTFKSNLDRPNLNTSASLGFSLKKFSARTDFSSKSFDAYQLEDLDSQVYNPINIDTVLVYPIEKTNIDGYNDYTINQKFKYKFNKRLEVNLKGSYYNHNQYDFNPNNKYQKYEDLTYGGNVKYKFNNYTGITASFNRDQYNKYDYLEKLDEKRLNYTNTFLNPRLIGTLKYKEKQNFTLGTEYLNEKLLTDKFVNDTLTEKQVNTSVFFAQDDIAVTDKINVIVGGRTDYHSAFGLHFSPKISGMYKFGDHAVRLNYAKGFRAPTLKELYMDWDLLGMFVLKGNENLQPETNDYLSGSIEYSKNNLNGSVNIYKNWFKNKIDGEWQNNETVYQYVNIESTELTGLELLLKYRLNKNFRFSGGYSFVHDNRSAESQMSTISPHSANGRIEYAYKKGIYNLNINLNAKFTGAKNYNDFDDVYYRGQWVKAEYEVHYNAFSIWNLAISQKFYNSVNLILGVNNLFDYKSRVVNFNTTIMPGRRVFVSIKMDIDNFFNNK